MLEGTAALEEAVEVARTVDGVREVKTQQVEIPPIPPFVAYPPGLAGPSRFGLSSGTSATFAVTSIFCFFLSTWSVAVFPTGVSATSRWSWR